MAKKKTTAPPVDLREACVVAAHAFIAEHGIEKLSLRDVARKLGVSHQAPYKHYSSRDHLLAEVIRRCFEGFTAYLEASNTTGSPQESMTSLGQAYLRYAHDNPLEYRLMFGTPWPDTAEHPELLRDCRYAFDVLRHALARIHGKGTSPSEIDLDALFVWSSMHGLASIMQSNVMERLDMKKKVLARAQEHTLLRVRSALG